MALKVWLPLSGDVTTNYGLTEVSSSANTSSQSTPTPVYANGILGNSCLALGSAGAVMGVSASVGAQEALSAFSVTMWVKEATNGVGVYLFSINEDGAKVLTCVKAGDGYQIPELASGTLFTLSSGWNHVAITADGTTVKAYVNGVQSDAGDVDQVGSIDITEYTVNIASYKADANTDVVTNFNGYISNFKLYDTAISLFEVVNEANGLVVNYSFNGKVSLGTGVSLPQGTTAADFGFGDKEHDLSGNEYDASYGDPLPVSSNDTAMYSTSMNFTEAGAVTSPTIKAQEFASRYTLSVWAKGTGTIATVGSGTAITTSDTEAWHNIVVTSAGKKYVDGVETGSLTGAIESGNVVISIGGSFTGLISDFRIYATAMSADQIANLYTRKAAVDNSGKLIAAEFVVDDENIEKPGFNKKGVVSAANIGNWTGESESPTFINGFSITAATGVVNTTDVIEF